MLEIVIAAMHMGVVEELMLQDAIASHIRLL